MNLFRDLSQLPDRFLHGALSIGNFDGVHQGHARIVKRLVKQARRIQGPAVALTFDPHPGRLLRPDRAPSPLCWTERKARLLTELGVDAVAAYPTDLEFLKLNAREFFDAVVRDRLGARALVEGPSFFFGRGRAGNVEALQGFCAEAGMTLEVVEPVRIGRSTVSSSLIRSLIAGGKIDEAATLLTRPYRIRGTVVRGAGRGAQLGFPTANLGGIDTLLPGEGIYAGRAYVAGQDYAAAVNIGPNPTFDEEGTKVEAHLVGYQGELYGRPIELDFLARLRDILRFGSAEELVVQLRRDVESVLKIVRGGEPGVFRAAPEV